MYNVSVQRLWATIKKQRYLFAVVLMALVFFTAYSVLTIVRHDHYQSFGYDLGINDQLVWRYSTFQSPTVTVAPVPDRTKFVEHVELIYSLIAPFYWIWSSRQMLLLVQAAIISSGAIAIFLLARSKKLHPLIQLAIPFSYLTFYGLQNAVWFDVHSASMAAGILAWFIYFLETKNQRLTVLFFLIAITAKENIAFITLFITSFTF